MSFDSFKNTGKLVSAAAALALLAGCTVYEHDHHDHDHDRVVVEERHDYRPVPPPPPPPPVRHERTLITEGKHLIEFRAPRPGVATVVDVEWGRDILTLDLRPGDHLTVDPDKNKIYVNDHKVYNDDLKSKHLFRIYFQEGYRR